MATSDSEAKHTWFLSFVSHFSLFPLLFKPNLVLIKISLFLTSTLMATNGLNALWPSVKRPYLLALHELLYIVGFIGLIAYEYIVQYFIGFDKKFPFLPLLLTSVYSSIGIMYFWLKYYASFLISSNANKKVRED